MAPATPKSKETPEYKTIAKQWAQAKKVKDRRDAKKGHAPATSATLNPTIDQEKIVASRRQQDAMKDKKRSAYEKRWWWTTGFWVWILFLHSVGLFLFTRGFLLTRLVLDKTSSCTEPPVSLPVAGGSLWNGHGSVDGGCWHPNSFSKTVIVLIDALRYDFTVPPQDPESARIYHNALTFLHETAVKTPENAFLRPFIADPPTTTLQRLKGLTTGTLPTFLDAGSNFAGSSVDEDNLLCP